MKKRLLLAAGLSFTAASVLAEDVRLSGDDAYTAMRKMTCGTLEQGKPRYGYYEGRTWARVPGQKDRHLFDFIGVNTRHCGDVSDPEQGDGYRSFSREILLYLDPETGELVDRWENPYTGETVDVVHVANDPVNMRAPRFRAGRDGKPPEITLRRYGDITFSSSEIPLFYENPLGGDYQRYVGGTYHAMEIFNSAYLSERLFDPAVTSVGQSNISWSRVSQWLPWMEMGDRPGILIFNGTGFSSFDRDRVPEAIVEAVETRFQGYLTPPPLGDDRPNETSWTVFKKYLESRRSDAD